MPVPSLRRSLLALLLGACATGTNAAEPYFPSRGDWARCEPQCRMEAAAVAEAVREVQKNENPLPRDQAVAWAQTFGSREPHFGGLLGPMAVRGPMTGVVIHRGKVQVAFGEPERVDMSHSITKSFLSAVVGLAVQDGRIASVDAPVVRSMPREVQEAYFSTPKNAAITWTHLLQQSSDWEGTLWGRPDWADRPVGATPDDWPKVPRVPAGTVHEYNDVRINLLALAALQVLRRPLPEVLRERLMEPMQASPNWRWHGYSNSWVELDGQRLQSVRRRRALGRWPVPQRLGHGALRHPATQQRPLGRSPAAGCGVAARRRYAFRPQPGRGLRKFLPEHRPQGPALGPGQRGDPPRQWAERHLRGPRERVGGGAALGEGRRGDRRLHRAPAGGAALTGPLSGGAGRYSTCTGCAGPIAP